MEDSVYLFGDYREKIPLRTPLNPELKAQIDKARQEGMTDEQVISAFGAETAEAYFSNPYNIGNEDPLNAA